MPVFSIKHGIHVLLLGYLYRADIQAQMVEDLPAFQGRLPCFMLDLPALHGISLL